MASLSVLFRGPVAELVVACDVELMTTTTTPARSAAARARPARTRPLARRAARAPLARATP